MWIIKLLLLWVNAYYEYEKKRFCWNQIWLCPYDFSTLYFYLKWHWFVLIMHCIMQFTKVISKYTWKRISVSSKIGNLPKTSNVHTSYVFNSEWLWDLFLRSVCKVFYTTYYCDLTTKLIGIDRLTCITKYIIHRKHL